MNTMPLITQIYLLCSGVGSLIVVLMAASGAAHAHGHTGGHAHGGHGHSGASGHSGHTGASSGQVRHGAPVRPGHSSAARGAMKAGGAHSSAHTGSQGSQSGSHGATAQASGHSANGHGAGGQGNAASHLGKAGETSEILHHTLLPEGAKLPARRAHKEHNFFKMLLYLNPTTLSTFVASFGAWGLLISTSFPWIPPVWTAPLAVLAGLLSTRLLLKGLSWMTAQMFDSGTFTDDSLVGSKGEVTVGFCGDQLGEIVCLAGGSHFTLSARGNKPGLSFKRNAPVIVCDIRDDIAFVEPWSEVDPFDQLGTSETSPQPIKEVG